MSEIRYVNPEDLDGIKYVIDSNELFPADLLDEMIEDYFQNQESKHIWLIKEINDVPIAVCYCAPEKMTNGTVNLYLIAVHKEYQGTGIGTELLRSLKYILKEQKQRVLLVETSGFKEFRKTREFYLKRDFHREATIIDFYQEGEDKIVFWKKLTNPS